ncbi:MAG: amidohydrolase family protein [Clostridia bacterium]
MFFDLHAHVYKYQYPSGNGESLFIGPEQLVRRHDALGIKKAVLLPIVSPEVYVPQSVGEVIEIADRSNGRFIPFCNIDPRVLTNTSDAPLGNLLEHYRALGCRGIGEVMPNMELDHPKMRNLFRHVQEIGFPLIFDLTGNPGTGYGLYDEPGLPRLESCLNEFPKLLFIGHGPAFWAEISRLAAEEDRFGYPGYPVEKQGRTVALLREYPNLHAELSARSGANALMRDRDHASSFLEEFRDKLYFGTDICTDDQPALSLDFLMKMKAEEKIREETFHRIAAGNALNLFGL